MQISKRSPHEVYGRTDGNTKVIIPIVELPDITGNRPLRRNVQAGDYVLVKINGANSQVLKGDPLLITNLHNHFAPNSRHLEQRLAAAAV